VRDAIGVEQGRELRAPHESLPEAGAHIRLPLVGQELHVIRLAVEHGEELRPILRRTFKLSLQARLVLLQFANECV
jgi:hypothetical protein